MSRLLAGDSSFCHLVSSPRRYRRGLNVAMAAGCLAVMMATAHAGISLRAGGMSGMRNGSSSAAATSQTATAATDNTSQTVTASAGAQQAQASLARSVQALQALQAAQLAARNAAINGANNLGLNPNNPGQTLANVTDGLGGGAGLSGGLVPTGGLTATSTPSVQIVKLGGAGDNTISLSSGGTVVVPEGTPGSDSVTVTGSGSVTSTGGSVTANAGSLTTSSGATLSSVQGGSISLTGGSSTLSVVTTTNLTSSLAGTITLANSGGTFALAAGTATTIPAGSTISFSGTGAGTVTIASSSASTTPSTVTLKGAGTLTLANTAANGSGGTITTNTGVVSFSNGVTTTLPAGSTINLTGTGSLSFAGATNDTLSVLLNTGQNGTVNGTNNFTTTGSILSTTSFNVPSSWVLGTGGALSQSFDPATEHFTDTVTQEQQQALLYWSAFNIGKNTTLSFDQSAGGANVSQWVAINEITDPSLAPSQILGAIKAPGQVYVINQNGIIFGGSSQVNTGALTASSLALNPSYVTNGLLNDAGNDYQFQFSSLFMVSGNTVAPLWTAPPSTTSPNVASEETGDVTVQAGAQLTSPTNAEHQGGRVALIAPNVTNDGTINTPDGQTILASGLQVGFSSHNSGDASLRGLDVFVGQVTASALTLPTGNLTFNGLPAGQPLTFSGSGQVGSYTAPGATSSTPIMGGVATTIPIGSAVHLNSGAAPSFTAVTSGKAGDATNNGDIEAARADVSMVGAAVNQMGIINSSTSVTLNGRIDLLADYDTVGVQAGTASAFYPSASGVVTMGGESVTQILPESSSSETTVGTELAFSSLVDVQGLTIDMLPGSLLYAPSANVPSSASGSAVSMIGQALSAGVSFDAGSWSSPGGYPTFAQTSFTNSDGQINLGAGSTIDVSGLENVSASVAEDIIPVQLRGPELANSPLQRGGTLRGTTVYVDIRDFGVYDGTPWIGTPIGDVSGYVNDIERTVGELSTSGGSVALDAGTNLAFNSGATINASGGWINYAGANVATTEVMSHGQILSISQATPNLAYQGIDNGYTASSAKWGVSQNFINSLTTGTQYDAGYVQGGNAGSIALASPSMTIGGSFYGQTSAGPRQRTLQSSLASTYASSTFLPTIDSLAGLPNAGSLSISFLQLTNGRLSNVLPAVSPNLEFETDSYIAQNSPAAGQIFLSQDIINSDGFGTVGLNSTASGNIVVPAGISLTTSAAGDIIFNAANVDIEGSLTAPNGEISMTAKNLSSATSGTDPGTLTLGANGSLSAAGLVVDDRGSSPTAGTLPLALNGGSVSLSAPNLDLEPGSTIDVSGGASVTSTSQISYGNAGSISLQPGGSGFIPGSTFSGYSGAAGGGGSLSLSYDLVQVGGSSLLNGDSSTAPFIAGEPGVAFNGTTLWLDPAGSTADFFSEGGFSNFTIQADGAIETNSQGKYQFNNQGNPIVSPAILFASGAAVHPLVEGEVLGFGGDSLSLTPMSAAQAGALLPYQRSAANLTFDALGVVSSASTGGPPLPGGGTYSNGEVGGGLLVRGDIVIQQGASIVTDPQTNSNNGVSLVASNGIVAVLGQIIVPGGTISIKAGSTTAITSNNLLFYNNSPLVPFPTVDLAPGSLLSTAGTLEQTLNTGGDITGSVLPGGKISISGNIVVESGATVDVSGASSVVDETSSALGEPTNPLNSLGLVPTRVDSNAGSISFNASQLFYNDGTLLGSGGGAALPGGSTAQGGSISVSAGFSTTVDALNPFLPTQQDITLIVTQQGLNNGFSLPSGVGSGMALLGEAIPGSSSAVGATVNASSGEEGVFSYFAASSNLFEASSANKSVSNNGGMAGGFGSLNLAGTVDFLGSVDITTSNTIKVAGSSAIGNGFTGGVIYANGSVVLTSPYVSLNSYATSELPDVLIGYPGASSGPGGLTVDASVLTDVGNLSLENIGTLTFNSAPDQAGDIRGVGTLQVDGLINMNAAQIYPPTESVFTIMADNVSITAPQGQTLPELPLSAGGTLNIDATDIEQDGVLRAPFGTINLGTSATQSVILSAGSITSVSAVDPTTGQGITIPYGTVDDNGDWLDPEGNNITLTGPPVKAVKILGQNVELQSGSTIDIAGGGDLYAYQFNPGTGGNQDILASLGSGGSSTSFAIIPGYSLKYAPEGAFANGATDSVQTNNVTDVGYYNSSLAVGEEIYLNGSSGVAAGYYTLLPARYAALPGAFLISPGGSAPGASRTEADGSSFVSGYVTSGLNPGALPVLTGYDVYSNAQVLNRAPYVANLANTFFPQAAANNNESIPRLPEDSGQLVLNAADTMTLQGTLLSQPGTDGLGGEVDIASSENIAIVDSTVDTSGLSNTLVLDSTQLTDFGADSLLIGGYRTTTTAGTSVTVTTDEVEVNNGNASTTLDGTTVQGLAAPDITLVSKQTIQIDPDSIIEQVGSPSDSAQEFTVVGNGSLLRVSSDPTAEIVRQNVTADTTSVLSIGNGVKIVGSGGGTAGALILDSSGAVSLSQSTISAPQLLAKSLTLDSSLINIELGTPQTAPTSGLIITSNQLNSLLVSTQALSLLSYSSIAFYGGQSGPVQIGSVTTGASGAPTYQLTSLALHADEIIYSDTQSSSGLTINAQTVSLDNLPNGSPAPAAAGLGTASGLTINAQTITLGAHNLDVEGFGVLSLNADSAVLLKGLGETSPSNPDALPTPSSFNVSGNLILTTPLITGASVADQAITSSTTSNIDEAISAGGALTIQAPTGDTAVSPAASTLGSVLTLSAASIAQQSGNIVLHSGILNMEASGLSGSGDITVGGTLDVSGASPTFFNLNKYTSAGQITLDSQNGNVTIASTGEVNVSAPSGQGTADSGVGNGGSLAVIAGGVFTPGKILGQGGTVSQSGVVIATGTGGSFTLDAGTFLSTGPGDAMLSTLESSLTGFATQSIRDRDDTSVTVDGTVDASSFNLSTDAGSIFVSGTINASNVAATDPYGNPLQVGGSISLEAGGSVELTSTGVLDVSGKALNNAGQGGSISIQAGAYENTALSTSAGIDLAGTLNLDVNGGPGGTLILAAPQITGGAYGGFGQTYTPVPVAIGTSGSAAAPTDVAVAPVTGSINGASSVVVEGVFVQDAQDANALIDNYEATAQSNASAFMANAANIQSRIFGATAANVQIEPGEEIDNSVGSLELQNSWDLSQLRYGSSQNIPGILTLRAAGNINFEFLASLTDGFDTSTYGVSYLDPLMAAGSQSWSYNITAGADFSSASISSVQSERLLQQSGLGGSIEVGVQNPSGATVLVQNTEYTPDQFFQTIRTGTGNITINAGGDVLLLDNLATIYTAGSQVNPTAGFTPPVGFDASTLSNIPAAYSDDGGNVTITAQGMIAHETYQANGGPLVADSSAQLPTSWLYRQGTPAGSTNYLPTSWWVDFSNYFEGVGALGGGNVSLTAGGSIANVDVAVPTNAWLLGGTLTELGGGDLTLKAGGNIDGGVYYVERGQGSLTAGGQVLTNSTRAAVALNVPATPLDLLPTTLFLGEGSFAVTATDGLFLGPVSNPFLLPQSYGNGSSFAPESELSFFSTYAPEDAVNAVSLTGNLTIKDDADTGEGSLEAWYTNVMGANPVNPIPGFTLSDAEPWLELASGETLQEIRVGVGPAGSSLAGALSNAYGGVGALMPPTLRATALGGDIDLVGALTLAPAPDGTINLIAEGNINAFTNNYENGVSLQPTYGSGVINLSDSSPANLPTVQDPFTSYGQLSNLSIYFDVTGATSGLTLQDKQDFHANIDGQPLHVDDPSPLYIYAETGNISGLNLFSGKQAQIIAGQDITDIALYIQNTDAADVSLVEAGRDIVAYDLNSPPRTAAGIHLIDYNSQSDPIGDGPGAPNSGDIQISGPGAVEVLAGQNLTLGNDGGVNPNNTVAGDGIGDGLVSIGGSTNPFLPFLDGANIVAGAGVSAIGGIVGNSGVPQSALDEFINAFLNPSSTYAATYLPDVAADMGIGYSGADQTWTQFQALAASNRDQLALDIFYLVLRDAGRNHNLPGSPGFGNYDAGYQAISDLFPSSGAYSGSLNVTSREIKTTNGGDIDLLAPGGQVTVGVDLPSAQAVDQGILTVDGGNINIFANGSVNVGTSRIFTLHGGNEILWSTNGNIDAGASSKTVLSAPPTRVIVDPTSGAVELDLAGLATGGGIGVLESVVGAPPGDVDLIAPSGIVDAGDAGIRASGNLNIAAAQVLNASNITVGGKSSGVPAGSSVNLGALSAASSAAGSATASAQNGAPNNANSANNAGQDLPSIVTVEVLGYGGGDDN